MYAQEAVTPREDNPFVEKFESFFRDRLMKDIELLVNDYPSKKSLLVNYRDMEHYDVDLADEILENPDVCLAAAHEAIKNVEVPLLEID